MLRTINKHNRARSHVIHRNSIGYMLSCIVGRYSPTASWHNKSFHFSRSCNRDRENLAQIQLKSLHVDYTIIKSVYFNLAAVDLLINDEGEIKSAQVINVNIWLTNFQMSCSAVLCSLYSLYFIRWRIRFADHQPKSGHHYY